MNADMAINQIVALTSTDGNLNKGTNVAHS